MAGNCGSHTPSNFSRCGRAWGPGDDPLDTLLVERIVLTWARLQYVEEQVSYTYMPDYSNAATAEHWEKRLNDANSRFLRSCMALARVRKLRQRRPMSAAAISAALGASTLGDLHGIGGLLAKRRQTE
jgi:hypothetical protein